MAEAALADLQPIVCFSVPTASILRAAS